MQLPSPFRLNPTAVAMRMAAGSTGADDPIKAVIKRGLESSCTIYVYAASGSWTGSGFHVGHGHVVTASHVAPPELLREEHEIRLTFDGQRLYGARLVASDVASDAALLSCPPIAANIPAVILADSDNMEVGDMIAVIASPEGWHDTATEGIISNIHQQLGQDAPSQAWNDIMFIDADILEGSSGGMVIGTDGRVCGLVMGVTGKLARIGIGERAVCPSNKISAMLSAVA